MNDKLDKKYSKTIGINASFLRKRGSGIGEVTWYFVRALVESVRNGQFAQTRFILYVQEEIDLGVELPANISVRIIPSLYRRDDLVRKIWWERWTLPQAVAADGCNGFVSLYQSATVLRKVRHVMVVHDLIPSIFPQYVDNLRKKIDWELTLRAIKQADKLISVSKHTKKDLIKYLEIPSDKIAVAYVDCAPAFKSPIETAQIEATLRKYDLRAGKYIYFGGGLDMRKNAKRLLEAYRNLRKLSEQKDTDFQCSPLVISGKLQPQLAPLWTDIEKLVDELELSNSVHILGFVPDEDLPAIYAGAQIFVYPSLYEGFGMPVLEALSVGVPVAASEASSVPEVAGDAALYFDPADTDAITSAMLHLLNDSTLRKILTDAGKKQVTKFSWQKFAQKVLAQVDLGE